MKKLILLFAAIAATTLFSSCDDKGDDNNIGNASDIVGEWYMSKDSGYYTDTDGSREDYNDSFTLENTETLMTFNEDGTMVGYDQEDGEIDEFMSGTWEIDGNQLKMSAYGEHISYKITTLNATTLTLTDSGEDEDGPYEDNVTFTKIR